MTSDWPALVASAGYAIIVIGLAEGLRRWRGYAAEFTRKFIHIGAGMWAFGTVILFRHWTTAIIPPLCFVLINYLSCRLGLFTAMETGERNHLGTVYFPISFALITAWLWNWPHLLVASLMPMTWGDAMAAILGRPYGHYRFRFLGHCRTLEGSLSMLIFSFLSTFLTLVLLAPFGILLSMGLAIAVALLATAVEFVSPWGTDNLTVPLITALFLYLVAR